MKVWLGEVSSEKHSFHLVLSLCLTTYCLWALRFACDKSAVQLKDVSLYVTTLLNLAVFSILPLSVVFSIVTRMHLGMLFFGSL